jgi:hypothetical protein
LPSPSRCGAARGELRSDGGQTDALTQQLWASCISICKSFASAALLLSIVQMCGLAQSSSVCPRFAAGSLISAPQDLFSQNGILQINFTYQTTVDQYGNTVGR